MNQLASTEPVRTRLNLKTLGSFIDPKTDRRFEVPMTIEWVQHPPQLDFLVHVEDPEACEYLFERHFMNEDYRRGVHNKNDIVLDFVFTVPSQRPILYQECVIRSESYVLSGGPLVMHVLGETYLDPDRLLKIPTCYPTHGTLA